MNHMMILKKSIGNFKICVMRMVQVFKFKYCLSYNPKEKEKKGTVYFFSHGKDSEGFSE